MGVEGAESTPRGEHPRRARAGFGGPGGRGKIRPVPNLTITEGRALAEGLDRGAPARVAAALRASGAPGVGLLHSARGTGQAGLPGAPGELGALGRYSFVAAHPVAVASAPAGQDLRLVAGPPEWSPEPGLEPLAAAAELLERAGQGASGSELPFAGGGLLTLAYDLGRRYEEVPERAQAEDSPPDLHLAVYRRVLCFDHLEGTATLSGPGPGLAEAEVLDALASESAPSRRGSAEPDWGLESLDCEAYRAAVVEAQERIRRGDLFEVNLSRRHVLEGVDVEGLAAALPRQAAAAYMADLDLGDRRLLSASPERFLRFDGEGRVESWPIKGTRPRHADPELDAAAARELMESAKDAAELAMITDLVRNDLGRVARPGSVRVVAPRLLQSWPTVHHTLSVVAAELAPGQSWDDLVRAAFPPGSVTGAPKVEAMRVIEDLEPVRRGLYCGAFGWVGFDGALDLAVAIRIAEVKEGRARIHAGGAVLLDSDAAEEELEARTKARALLAAAAEARA
jgi:para-aminobenzoate synthetase component I